MVFNYFADNVFSRFKKLSQNCEFYVLFVHKLFFNVYVHNDEFWLLLFRAHAFHGLHKEQKIPFSNHLGKLLGQEMLQNRNISIFFAVMSAKNEADSKWMKHSIRHNWIKVIRMSSEWKFSFQWLTVHTSENPDAKKCQFF